MYRNINTYEGVYQINALSTLPITELRKHQ